MKLHTDVKEEQVKTGWFSKETRYILYYSADFNEVERHIVEENGLSNHVFWRDPGGLSGSFLPLQVSMLMNSGGKANYGYNSLAEAKKAAETLEAKCRELKQLIDSYEGTTAGPKSVEL